ncbi:hypothetical protein PHLCEN_2v9682 [Hermanssonia centrifuga]|uniref:Uncharacterized protein n=1 Tax=Hermanssonia centrifuga TaxID=98765 RepID=A0A2R6NQ18_9APHY|nr:hypothetical protein PHLCEN_2v9682 [Hermanssonia centrifuga]
MYPPQLQQDRKAATMCKQREREPASESFFGTPQRFNWLLHKGSPSRNHPQGT